MCSTGCPTPGQHLTWGECIRAKNIEAAPPDAQGRRDWDSGLRAYREARRQGMQPAQPTRFAVENEKRKVGA